MTLIITDQTDIAQLMNTQPFGGCRHPDDYKGPPCTSAPDDKDLIPWEEFPDRIADMERSKTTLVDIWQKSPIGKPMQSYTMWCWTWCVADAVLVYREAEGLPYVPLSPSSVAGPIMNFANVGGWPEQALDYIMKNGIAPVSHVPYVTQNPRDFKAGWKEEAMKYRVTKFEAVGTNKQRIVSKLLQRKPLCSAFMWLEHAMAPLAATDDNPRLAVNDPLRYGLKVLNSHNDGIMKLEGRRAMPDSAFAIAQTNFAE